MSILVLSYEALTVIRQARVQKGRNPEKQQMLKKSKLHYFCSHDDSDVSEFGARRV